MDDQDGRFSERGGGERLKPLLTELHPEYPVHPCLFSPARPSLSRVLLTCQFLRDREGMHIPEPFVYSA
jgi:hypothetical protein